MTYIKENLKLWLIIAIIAIPITLITVECNGQGEMPVKDGKVFYELIDSSVVNSADELHSKASVWLANVFKSSKSVIQLDDKQNHTIIGKGNLITYTGIIGWLVKFSIRIDTKDKRYRAQIYDITFSGKDGSYERSAEWYNAKKGQDKIKEKVNDEMVTTLSHLKMSMSKVNDTNF